VLERRLRGLGLDAVRCRLAGPVLRIDVAVAGIALVEAHSHAITAWTQELGLPPAAFGLLAN